MAATSSPPIRILLVDDSELVRARLRALRSGDARLHATADVGIDAPQEAAIALLAEIHDALTTPVIVELPQERVAPMPGPASRPSAVFTAVTAQL